MIVPTIESVEAFRLAIQSFNMQSDQQPSTSVGGGSRGKQPYLLCLDGGGIRGLSSLYILKQLMEKIDPEKPPKPCEYFDMIGGTSTGGLIAIMLGRLRMTVDECIRDYRALSTKVFTRKHRLLSIRGHLQGRYDSKALEEAIKDVVQSRGLDREELFRDDRNDSCKT